MSPDVFIYTTKGAFHSLIDGRSFPALKDRELAIQQCRAHVAALIEQQDGGTNLNRSLAERKNLYHALATP
jgi:hypothetical protein